MGTIREKDAIFIFEEIMMGRIDCKFKVKNHYAVFKGEDDDSKLMYIGAILRYICEDLLNWSMEDTAHYLTPFIFEKFQIDKIIPVSKRNLFYYCYYNKEYTALNINNILYYMYPEKYKNSSLQRRIVIDTYKQFALIEEYENAPANRVDKNFFDAVENGIVHLSYVMQYLDSVYLSYMTLEEKYNFFYTSEAIAFLKRFKIYNAFRNFYNNDLAHGYYDLQPLGDRDPYLYLKVCVNHYIDSNKKSASK